MIVGKASCMVTDAAAMHLSGRLSRGCPSWAALTAAQLAAVEADDRRARVADEHVYRPWPQALQQRVAGQGQGCQAVEQGQGPDLLLFKNEGSVSGSGSGSGLILGSGLGSDAEWKLLVAEFDWAA